VASDTPFPRIDFARDAAALEAVRTLFREYAASLDFGLDYQDFDGELAALPGKYAPPAGALLLATVGGEAAGCGALRELAPGIAEMKRLYVRHAFRALGLGRALTLRLIDEARSRGHRRLRLDTVDASMARALALYRALGFVEIAPYYPSPIPGTVFLELDLEAVR